jgi:chemotaxis-related protein WspB
MKALVFHIGPDRYGLRLGAVARVLPAMELKQVPLAPHWVAGLMDLHGQPVPVIDLSRLAGLAPQAPCFDSRIVVIDYPVDGRIRALGLLAEHVIGIDSIADDAFADSGVQGAPFLGQVAGAGYGMLQLVEPEQLLAPEVRALLFQSREPA